MSDLRRLFQVPDEPYPPSPSPTEELRFSFGGILKLLPSGSRAPAPVERGCIVGVTNDLCIESSTATGSQFEELEALHQVAIAKHQPSCLSARLAYRGYANYPTSHQSEQDKGQNSPTHMQFIRTK